MTPSRPGLLTALIAVNAVVLSLGLFVIATSHGTVFPTLDFGIGDHWPVQHRLLAVVDRTGDPGWHQAITDAITTWDRGASGVTLTLTTGTGACRQQLDHIEMCQETADRIAARGAQGEQGLFIPAVGAGNEYRSVVLLVCSDCDAIDQDRQTVIATHELGHALGLTHNPNPESVMYFVGGSPVPDARDYEMLRAREGARSDQAHNSGQTAGPDSGG